MNKLSKQIKKAITPRDTSVAGTLGDLNGVVIVPGTHNLVFVTLHGSNRVVKALNTLLPPAPKTEVVLDIDPYNKSRYKIVGVNNSYSTDVPFALVPRHGDSHTYPAGDAVYFRLRQFMPLRVSPATVGGLAVDVQEGWVQTAAGQFIHYEGAETISLSGHTPAAGARWVLVEIDGSSGGLTYIDGSVKSPSLLNKSTDIPARTVGRRPLAAIRLMAGQATIRDGLNNPDLLDLRFSDLSSAKGSGDVFGNASVTDGHLAVFDADGYHIKDGGAVPAGGGDMLAATYDPQTIAADAFDLANQTGLLADGHLAPWAIVTHGDLTVDIHLPVRAQMDSVDYLIWRVATITNVDLTTHVPSSATEGRYVTIYWDADTNTIVVGDGSIVAPYSSLTIANVLILGLTSPMSTLIGYVRLYNGQTVIAPADIVPLGMTNLEAAGGTPVRTMLPDGVTRNGLIPVYYGQTNLTHSTKTIADVTPPTTTAENDIQVGGVGATAGQWIKKTLAEFVTILRTSLDAIYSAAAHTHAYVPTSRTITTTSPLTIAGTTSADLSADRTLAIPAATASVPGHATAAQIAKLDGIATGANLYVHPNHSGDVTSAGDGATTIGAGKVTLAMLANMATASLFYRKTAGAGAPEVNTLATLKTDLAITAADVGIAAETNAAELFRVAASPGGVCDFAGLINTVVTTTVVYKTPTGTEAAMVPFATSNLAKMRLYNTTRGNYALIANCVVATKTITLTANAPANWAANDVITIQSQTVTFAASGNYFADLEITSGPIGKSALILYVTLASATVGDAILFHPLETFATSKKIVLIETTSNQAVYLVCFVKMTSNVFCFGWTGTPAALIVREQGYIT